MAFQQQADKGREGVLYAPGLQHLALSARFSQKSFGSKNFTAEQRDRYPHGGIQACQREYPPPTWHQRKSSVAGSRADTVAWGLDWHESQPVATGQLTAGYSSRALAPGYRPGWVWQLSCSGWFRPPTRGTAGQSGTGAACWAGLQGEGRAGTATAVAGSARGRQVQELEAGRSWAES